MNAESDYIAVNNRILRSETLAFPINDSGFLYGYGVFETILMQNQQLPFLEFHYDRLQKSADFLSIELPLSYQELQDMLKRLITQKGKTHGKLNLYLTAGDKDPSQAGFQFSSPKLISVIRDYIPKTSSPISLSLASLSYAPSPLQSYKSLSYAPYILEQQAYAPKTPLLLSPDGFLLETPTAAVSCIKDQTLFFPKTDPARQHYRLHSVSEAVIKHHAKDWDIHVEDRSIHIKDLKHMDEIFLCNALQGIIPVSCIDEDKSLRSGKETERLASLWQSLILK